MRFRVAPSSQLPAIFTERLFHGDPGEMVFDPLQAAEWCGHHARLSRYKVYWAMYQNDAYRDFHEYAQEYLVTYGLDRYIKGDFNPAARLTKFHVAHVHGGRLDPKAGPGTDQPTCLPFVVDDSVRPLIAKILADSRWSIRKSRWVRYGSCLGDGPIFLKRDPVRKQITISVMHPAMVEWIERDDNDAITAFGLIKQIPEDQVPDANGKGFVVYRLECRLELVSGDVFFSTTRDGEPYDWETKTWRGAGAAWVVRGLGACPLWCVAHGDTDLPFGQSEYEIGRAKMDRANDLASKLHDQIRKIVEGAWLLTGTPAPQNTPRGRALSPSVISPEQGRQGQLVYYSSNPDAKAISLVNNVPIGETAMEIKQVLMSIEDDYPELKFERLRTSGDISGEAMRTARQPASASIELMRAIYDQTLIEAIRLAIHWSAIEGYPLFSAFGNAQDSRLLDMRIGDRPVFAVDSIDRLDEEKKRWEVVQLAVVSGAPLEFALQSAGFTEQDIERIRTIKPMPTEKMKLDMEREKIQMQQERANFNAASRANPNGSVRRPVTA